MIMTNQLFQVIFSFFDVRTTDFRDTYGTSLLFFGVSGITISRSWSRLVRIFLNKNCNFIFQSLPQTNSWSCSHKGSHQSKDKLPTNIKRIGFAKRFLMLDRMKYQRCSGCYASRKKSESWSSDESATCRNTLRFFDPSHQFLLL